MKHRGILILDFGSQYTQIIARRFRELGFYAEIHSYQFGKEKNWDQILSLRPYGIVLSGGPNSVYGENAPQVNVKKLLEMAPILGICYGMQLIAYQMGGKVVPGGHREYGLMPIVWKKNIFQFPSPHPVWMSHGDVVDSSSLPMGFEVVAESQAGNPAAILSERAWAVQFHPEVFHTQNGDKILKSFAEDLCQASRDWDPQHMKAELSQMILQKVGPRAHVLCGLSGGVDSSVVAVLLTKVLGRDRVHCVFVDNGLLRSGEFEDVLASYRSLGLNVSGIPAQDRFLEVLRGVIDPEEKRKIIGRTFIEVFDSFVHHDLPEREAVEFLAQGTLYPDVIESVSSTGGSVTIKSHHNVGGLPEKMKLKLLEPVRDLFKDEVRALGKELGLPTNILHRHPFPGPGLGIRILGDVTKEKLEILRLCDSIFISYLREKNLYHKIWQAFCVLLPIHTVGVQGDARTYDQVLALRAVTSQDGMTAQWFPFTAEDLIEVSGRITGQVRQISRVVYDVTSKPPATIEWE